jgi:hypothetical protein
MKMANAAAISCSRTPEEMLEALVAVEHHMQ